MERAENYVNEAIFFVLLYLSALIFIDDMILDIYRYIRLELIRYIRTHMYVHTKNFHECIDKLSIGYSVYTGDKI